MDLLFKVINDTNETEATLGDTDFRAHFSAVNKKLSWYALKTSIRKVTQEYIIPYVGETFYKDFASRFQAAEMVGDPESGIVIGDPVTGIILGTGSMSTQDFALLELLRDALAEYTIWHATKERVLQFSDVGLRVQQDGEGHTRAAFAWEVKHYAWQRMLQGDKYLDLALKYVDENQDMFSVYEGNMDELPVNDFFIRTAAELKNYLLIADHRRTWEKLWPNMTKGHRKEILPILGQTLYDALLVRYREQTTTADDDKLLPYVQALIAHYSLWKTLPKLPVMIEEEGIRTITSTDGMNTKQLAHEERLRQLIVQVECDYNEAKSDLIEFLFKNITTYTDFETSEVYLDMMNDKGEGVPYSFGDGGVFLT